MNNEGNIKAKWRQDNEQPNETQVEGDQYAHAAYLLFSALECCYLDASAI